MQRSPFQIAERYIQIRKKFSPETWSDTILLINDLILNPLITIFFLLIKKSTLFTVIPSIVSTVKLWRDWFEYSELKMIVQKMYLITMASGGPFIVTNDTTYMPYVWADGVMRVGPHHLKTVG
jgi:hypothetical protein